MQTKVIIAVTLIALAAISKAQITAGVFFSNVGGAGSYPQVVNQPTGSPLQGVACDVTDTCQTSTLNIPASPLAPFNEEISLNLRGPLDLTRIAIYQPVNGQLQLVSNWQPGQPATNMTFLLNGNADYNACQGPALDYANSAGSAETNVATDFSGYLEAPLEITILSGVPCNGDCGLYRGVGYHGWAGDKIFVIETSMPHSGTSNDKPAVWSLNAQITRTGQYSCNCWPNCGEFDIAEVLEDGALTAHQTIYSYNGDQSSLGYFSRPVTGPSTYVVHYSITDNRVFAINVPGGCFQYSETLSSGYISALHALALDVNSITGTTVSALTGTCPLPPVMLPTAAATTPAPATTHAPTIGATTHAPTIAATTQAPTTASTTHAPTPSAVTKSPTTKAATSAATTHAPTTSSPTTSSPTTSSPTVASNPNAVINQCGAALACGAQCYDGTLYSCFNGLLCPIGLLPCGQACYSSALYACENEQLAQVFL